MQVSEKVREFRERAHRSRLKADITDDDIAKRMYEDAAREWASLADDLEQRARENPS